MSRVQRDGRYHEVWAEGGHYRVSPQGRVDMDPEGEPTDRDLDIVRRALIAAGHDALAVRVLQKYPRG